MKRLSLINYTDLEHSQDYSSQHTEWTTPKKRNLFTDFSELSAWNRVSASPMYIPRSTLLKEGSSVGSANLKERLIPKSTSQKSKNRKIFKLSGLPLRPLLSPNSNRRRTNLLRILPSKKKILLKTPLDKLKCIYNKRMEKGSKSQSVLDRALESLTYFRPKISWLQSANVASFQTPNTTTRMLSNVIGRASTAGMGNPRKRLIGSNSSLFRVNRNIK